MNFINYEKARIDIFNYLSIEALEKIGIMEPTEKQIALMEKLIRNSAEQEFKIDIYKGLKIIA